MSTIEQSPALAPTAIPHDYSKRMMVFGGRSSMELAAKVAGKLELDLKIAADVGGQLSGGTAAEDHQALAVVLNDLRHRLRLLDGAHESSPSLVSFAFFAA